LTFLEIGRFGNLKVGDILKLFRKTGWPIHSQGKALKLHPIKNSLLIHGSQFQTINNSTAGTNDFINFCYNSKV
jgi:hypothetical protein